jgi:hypothetical protein
MIWVILFAIVIVSAFIILLDYFGLFSIYSALYNLLQNDNAVFWFLMFMILLVLFISGIALKTGSKRWFSIFVIIAVSILLYNLYSLVL